MESNVFHTIEEKLPTFSKGKQQIATYILNNPNEAPFQTAAQIGKAVKISESTVVRFAGDLGYKGFPDFQKALQKEVKFLLQKGSSLSSSDPIGGGTEGGREKLDRDTHYEALDPSKLYALKQATMELSGCRDLYLLSTSLGRLLIPYCQYAGQMLLDTVIPLDSQSKEMLFTGISRVAPGDALLFLALGEIPSLFYYAIEQCKMRGARVFMITDSEMLHVNIEGVAILTVSAVQKGTVPDMTETLMVLHGFFSILEEKRTIETVERKKIIKEIWDTYEKFQS